MKKIPLYLLCILLFTNGFSQNFSADFSISQVNKKVKDFPDKLDLSTPLSAAITITNTIANGRNSLWQQISSSYLKYAFAEQDLINAPTDENTKNYYANLSLVEVIIYKSNVACVILQYNGTRFFEKCLYKENGNWLNAGENALSSLEECRNDFINMADNEYKKQQQIQLISTLPADTNLFIQQLKKSGAEPKQYLLDKLKSHKIVTYGEIHHRKISWELLSSTIADKNFPESVGTIFMELGSNKQNELDKFFELPSINKELLLEVFRDYMIAGWNEKSKFNFLVKLWEINKQLPKAKKIYVKAVDTPRCYTEKCKQNDTLNRDVYMANQIIEYMQSNKNSRNCLFVVGALHLVKTTNSAGAIIAKKYGAQNFSLFTHCPRVDNSMRIPERIRQGIFDYAFCVNRNKAIAFDLKNSAFGNEPFDGLYLDGSGKYEDNFDGYIFLGPLESEPGDEPLLDLYTAEFIKEIDRRYKLYFNTGLKESWHLTELTLENVIQVIKSETNDKRWSGLVKPMICKTK